ncbi:hypothetical protein CK203_023912 [Vitis vinifera]|uniref:Uncharacterized protein n=1 Tax=Vitis vinifera TaxID=29760 RepID=A0A438JAF5_VITVI|nr:hypothetical protein CK203_023912 [Vitis vinifera]
MDDLFRRASKYSMLEDDVRVTTQQILVVGQTSRSDAERSSRPPDQPRPSGRRQREQNCPELSFLTPLTVSYEKLLPMIQDLSDFRWPEPIRMDPAKRDYSKKVRDTLRSYDSGTSKAPVAPKAIINYIHEGPLDEEYNSKRKSQRLLGAASVCERVNSIRPGLTDGSAHPIDEMIVFP